jgi:hypothetical protein
MADPIPLFALPAQYGQARATAGERRIAAKIEGRSGAARRIGLNG